MSDGAFLVAWLLFFGVVLLIVWFIRRRQSGNRSLRDGDMRTTGTGTTVYGASDATDGDTDGGGTDPGGSGFDAGGSGGGADAGGGAV